METDYISRQDFRKELINTPFHPRCETTPDLLTSVQDRLNDTLELLDNFPAADVRPVKEGYWIESRTDYICSACGGVVSDEIVYMLQSEELPDYCPNCGAYMRPEPEPPEEDSADA